MPPSDSDFKTQIIEVKSNTLLLNCVRCRQRQSYDLVQFKASGATHITCHCGQRYQLGRRELRQFLRKRTKFPGLLCDANTQQALGKVSIIDLSVGGVGFNCSEKSIQVGDHYIIDFHLDDEATTHIQEPIVVRNVRESRVGAEFLNPDGYNFELDFYLTPM